eukprot:GHVQ01009146.1.p1 GENE.GHVQ01009146.1~~GHVQ01009146.1.p1  ORF type:complete len:1098 (-),score=127.73 GHVQ01009146.1:615-3908(-)
MAEGGVAPSELAQLELLCEAFYGGDPKTQSEAHTVLLPLLSHEGNISKLQTILGESHQPQALLFACSGLHKLFTQHWSHIPDKEKSSTREFLLNYLYARGGEMLAKAPVILGHFIRLLCRIVKLMWLENVSNQNIAEQVRMFMQGTTTQWVVGLEIYTSLTEDMQPTLGAQMARHRRTAMSFRDTALADIARVAIDTITQFLSGTIQVPNRQEETKLLNQVLKLTVNCLSFDFMGTVPDDTTDEQSTIMVPHSWAILRQENIPQMFFDLYDICWTGTVVREDCAKLCLSALFLISALRRSFFSREEDRLNYLSKLVGGTAKIIQNKTGLHHDGCYHDLCRLLGKINAANQLSELLQSEAFAQWIQELFSFTMQSLENWRHLPNSKHYLLGVWCHMVNPLIFLKERAPKVVEEYIQRITIAYIDSRMRIAEAVAMESGNDAADFDDPLASDVLRAEQLEVLAQLGRCRYRETAARVLELFDQTQTAMQQGTASDAVSREKITWLVFMIGCLIGANSVLRAYATRNGEDQATATYAINGGLATKVFALLEDTKKVGSTLEPLELAFLYFLEQFRKVYIGEHAKSMRSVESPGTLAYCLGLKDDDSVLDLLITKIGFNLQRRADSEAVTKRTLALFHDLANAINIVHCADRSPHLIVSAKLLLRNQTVKSILLNHADDRFTFLRMPRYGKYRTTYYYTLAKLIFMDVREDRERLEQFLKPQADVFDSLWERCGGGTTLEGLADCKAQFVGLCRDLRGICMGCNSMESYTLFFGWLVTKIPTTNSRIQLFTLAADLWWDDHDVIVPLLKFMSEFVYNKAQRISFDSSSANGLQLFRSVSSILVTYGSRILKRPSFTNLYRQKYKPLAVALEMFSHALSGNYVIFGVFEFYQDGALDNALQLGLQMCLAIPDADLQAYLKSLKPYYTYIDLVTRNFMPQVLKIQSSSLASLIRSLEEGLCSFESGVCMQCCSAIDNVVSFFYHNQSGPDDDARSICNFLATESQCLKRIFQLMFQLVLTGEFSSTWSMSRPLLGLILLLPDEFSIIKTQIGQQHSDKDKQNRLDKHFEDLMSNVEQNLSAKNKDLFTRNLYHFASVIRNAVG